MFVKFLIPVLFLAVMAGSAQAMDCTTIAFEALGLEDKTGTAVTNISATLVAAAGSLPEYCDVQGTILPEITFRVVLPTTTWNERFYMAGGGGFNGSLPNLDTG